MIRTCISISMLVMFLVFAGPGRGAMAEAPEGADDAARARFWIERRDWARALPHLERLVVDGRAGAQELWERARCRQELGRWARGLLDWKDYVVARGATGRDELFAGEGPEPAGYAIESSRLNLLFKPEERRILFRHQLVLRGDEYGRRCFRLRMGEALRLGRVSARERELVHARKGANLAVEFPWVDGEGRYELTLEGFLPLGEELRDCAFFDSERLAPAGERRRKVPLELVAGAPGGWEIVASGPCLGRGPSAGGSAARFRIPPDAPWTVGLGRWVTRSLPGPFGPVEAHLFGATAEQAEALAREGVRILRFLSRHFGDLPPGGLRLVELHAPVPPRGGLVPLSSESLSRGLTSRDLALSLAGLWWPSLEEDGSGDGEMRVAIRHYVAHLADRAMQGGMSMNDRMERLRRRLYDAGGEKPPAETRALVALHRLRGQAGTDAFKALLLAMRDGGHRLDREGVAAAGREPVAQWKANALRRRDVDLALGKIQGFRLAGRGQNLSDPAGSLHRYVTEIRLRNRGDLRYEGPVELSLRTLRGSFVRRVRLTGDSGTYHFTTAHPLVEVTVDPAGWIGERDRENNGCAVSPRLKTWRDWQELQG